ncbi:CaiB/BaiF CoA transferase family protein [Chloroflexota bacterium]
MASPLQGIRVVDLGMWYVAPEAAALLGDMGAEVIHLEQPGKGDQSRGTRGIMGISAVLPVGSSINFFDHNRNKKSITIDLTKADGREIAYRLIRKSDVLITNFRHRAVVKLGMDYETLSGINPRLVYGFSSAFGEKGPDAGAPAFALAAAARSGLMMSCSGGGETPCFTGIGIGDAAGALVLAMGVAVALVERERSGIGQEVIVSQLMSLMQLQRPEIAAKLLSGHELPRFDRKKQGNPYNSFYKCKGGRWIALAIMRYTEWSTFCKAIGHPDIENNPQFTYWMRRRFGDSSAAEEKDVEEKYMRETIIFLEELFASRTLDEWLQVFRDADIIAAPVNSVSDLMDDPQVIANEYITDWEHPSFGKIKFIGAPFRLSRTPPDLRYDASELGQHTEEVLTEICGYSWEEVGSFRERGLL